MKTRRNVLTASLAIAGALALSVASAQVERFGRDSAYATRAPTASTTVTTNVANADVTRYGRASAYATRAPAKTIAVTTTAGADAAIKPGRM